MFAELIGNDRNRGERLRIIHMGWTEHAYRSGVSAFDLIRRHNERAFVQVLHTRLGANGHS